MRLWVVIGQNAAHDLYSDLERGKLETKTPNNILHFSSWQLFLNNRLWTERFVYQYNTVLNRGFRFVKDILKKIKQHKLRILVKDIIEGISVIISWNIYVSFVKYHVVWNRLHYLYISVGFAHSDQSFRLKVERYPQLSNSLWYSF